jgi:hypothetical protein
MPASERDTHQHDMGGRFGGRKLNVDKGGAGEDIGARHGSEATWWGGRGHDLNKARSLYEEKVTKAGGHALADPKIARLLKSGYEGRFYVDTKEGKKAVTFSDAITHYWDQLRAGTAEIAEGDDKGKTIAEAGGVTVAKKGEAGYVEVTSDTKGGEHGKDAKDYAKHPQTEKDSKATGKVVIEAGAWLQSVFHITPSGSAAWANSTSPPPTNVQNGQLPGTTPGPTP